MPEKKVWFSTGAARGMGVDSATAARAAGNAVVATGREPRAIAVADRPDAVSRARPSSRRPTGTSAGQRGPGPGPVNALVRSTEPMTSTILPAPLGSRIPASHRDNHRVDRPAETTLSAPPAARSTGPAAGARRLVAGDPGPSPVASSSPRPSTWQHQFRARGLTLPRLPAGVAALLVLRLFIGLGWLRAFAEKATDPAWRDGGAIAAFLGDHLARGQVALPPYEALVAGVFLPHALALGWLIMAGQLLTGLALLTGALTRAALLGGLFMNVNFLLAGEPNPSAFYIVIQAALLATGAGAILSVDAWRAHRAPWPAPPATRVPTGRRWLTGAAGLGLAVAGYALLHAHDLSPAGSVHDPAVLLALLGGLAALWAALTDGTPADQPLPARRRPRPVRSRRAVLVGRGGRPA